MERFKCIKDYFMDDYRLAYKKGEIYTIKTYIFKDWFILPSLVDDMHKIKDEDEFYEYFEPYNLPLTGSSHIIESSNKDSIVNNVIESFKERSNAGFKKYGTNLDRKDLSPLEWLKHLQEELQDAILYTERLKKDLPSRDESVTSSPLLKVEKVCIETPFGNMQFGVNEVELKYSLDGKTVTLDIR